MAGGQAQKGGLTQLGCLASAQPVLLPLGVSDHAARGRGACSCGQMGMGLWLEMRPSRHHRGGAAGGGKVRGSPCLPSCFSFQDVSQLFFHAFVTQPQELLEAMSFRASLSVVLGCNFGAANRLLSAAERGEEQVVRQVRSRGPAKGLGVAP